MENQSKSVWTSKVFMGSVFLLGGLMSFLTAAGYVGPENNYLADNWGPAVVILLIVMFDLGWWYEKYSEHLAASKERRIVVLATTGFFVVMALIGFGSLAFVPRGFWRYSMLSGMYILGSGFLYHA